jgi:hypothetical protein
VEDLEVEARAQERIEKKAETAAALRAASIADYFGGFFGGLRLCLGCVQSILLTGFHKKFLHSTFCVLEI